MGEVKLTFEADSLKEIVDDFTSALEELGTIVVKPADEIPDGLEEMIKSKGYFLFRPGEGIPDGLLKELVEEDQEDVVDYLLENGESRERIMERMEDIYQEKNYVLFHPGEGIPEDLLKGLLQEDQEEVIDTLFENKDALQRIRERLNEENS